MEKVFLIYFADKVVDSDLPKISNSERLRILKAIGERLSIEPEVYGKPLRNSLKNYRSMRSGNHRVIFELKGGKVNIIMIEHRSRVYDMAVKRIFG